MVAITPVAAVVLVAEALSVTIVVVVSTKAAEALSAVVEVTEKGTTPAFAQLI